MKANFSLLTLLVVFATTFAHGQVIYKNFHDFEWIIPGSQWWGFSKSAYLDFNEDGVVDFRMSLSNSFAPQYSNVTMNIASYGNNAIKYDTVYYTDQIRCAWHDPMDTITDCVKWAEYATLRNVGEGIFGFITMGHWNINQEGYVGIRLSTDTGVHYGWIRVYYYNEHAIIYDCAYESTPDTPIIIGEGIDKRAQIYNIEDINDTGEACDIFIEFDKVYDETGLDKYRIMIIKSDSVGSFTLDKANQVQDYHDITPNGQNKSLVLPCSLMDVNGNSLISMVPYNVFVLSVMTSGNPEENELSQPSDSITLNYYIPVAKRIVAYDGGESRTPEDLSVRFSKPSIFENFIQEYRMIAIERDSLDFFELEDAANLPSNCYTSILPTGSNNYLDHFTSNTLDCYGNPIVPDKAYYVKILSVPHPEYSNVGSLSESSTVIALHVPSYLKAGEMNPARVEYVDFEPDQVAGLNNPYYFDMNSDGIDDFQFNGGYYWNPDYENIWLYASAFQGAAVNGINDQWLFNLPDSAMISALTGHWGDYGEFWFKTIPGDCWGYWQGYNQSPKDGIAGLAVIKENDTIYGWITGSTACSEDVHLKEYAYLKDNIVGYHKLNKGEATIYPNPVRRYAKLQFNKPTMEQLTIQIIGLMGNILKSSIVNTGESFTKLDFGNLPDGIYLVIVKSSEKSRVFKVVKHDAP